MSSAMPVEARKKPKSTATTAGPALIDPPRINTTRMIPNRSTTDSEMATTDHTLGRSALPALGRHVAHPRQNHRATNRPTVCGGWGIIAHFSRAPRTPRPVGTPQPRTPAQQFEGAPAQEFHGDRFHVHTTCSQVFRIGDT